MMRAVIIRRETGDLELEYVKVGKREGITKKENERISKDKPPWNMIKYIYPGMHKEKVKKIFDILG